VNPLLSTCLGSLIGVSLLHTLLRSLRHSHEAGFTRLGEKSPRFERMAGIWEQHWLGITGLLTLISGACQLATIGSAFLLFERWTGLMNPVALLGIAGYGLINILLCTSIPVVLSEYYADRITLRGLPVAWVLYRILLPLSLLVSLVEKLLHVQLSGGDEEGNRPSAGDEILTLVEQTRDHELDADERSFIRSALEFGETITREIMTPRVRMRGLEDTLTVREAVKEVHDSPYSRFPMFHEDYDEVLGMIHIKDLIEAVADGEMDAPLNSLMKPATFVPESMPISDLMRMMKQKKIHTAIAVDEYGGTAGVVTLEDILEELVGEIEDEHDQELKPWTEVRSGVFEVEASLSIDEANEAFGLHLPEDEDFDTIAGYLLATWGRIPRVGDHLSTEYGEIRVKAATPRQIQALTITPISPPAARQ
jgi:CBS domain containing-hemolysin-like protein